MNAEAHGEIFTRWTEKVESGKKEPTICGPSIRHIQLESRETETPRSLKTRATRKSLEMSEYMWLQGFE